MSDARIGVQDWAVAVGIAVILLVTGLPEHRPDTVWLTTTASNPPSGAVKESRRAPPVAGAATAGAAYR